MALEAPGLHLPTTRFSLNRRVAAGFLRPHCQNRAAQSPFCLGKTTRRIPTTILAGAVTVATQLDSKPVRIIALVGKGSVSPLKTAPWEEVMLHTAKRLKWVVFTDDICQTNDQNAVYFQTELQRADILVIVAVTNQESVKWIQTNSENIGNIICFDSQRKP